MEVMVAVVGTAEVEVGAEGMEGVREWPDQHQTQGFDMRYLYDK